MLECGMLDGNTASVLSTCKSIILMYQKRGLIAHAAPWGSTFRRTLCQLSDPGTQSTFRVRSTFGPRRTVNFQSTVNFQTQVQSTFARTVNFHMHSQLSQPVAVNFHTHSQLSENRRRLGTHTHSQLSHAQSTFTDRNVGK